MFTVAGWVSSVEAAHVLPPGRILVPIYKHSEMPYPLITFQLASFARSAKIELDGII